LNEVGQCKTSQGTIAKLYHTSDTCNVYVVQVGDRAILIDLGDGTVLDRLPLVGVKHVDWILFTHHHREQCQGIAAVDRTTTKVAAGAIERELFEAPMAFRKWYPKLGDKYSVYGASFVRPPAKKILIDQEFQDNGSFSWQGLDLQCWLTPGHSPGSMTYVLPDRDQRFVFTGDIIHDGAKMVTWFDSEWDYGFAKGIDTLIASVERLVSENKREPFSRILPSHGPPIYDAIQLTTYRDRLNHFRSRYVRGYPVFDMPNEQRDTLSQPTSVPLLNRVTPHLYKLRDSSKGKNFAMIIADSGHALVLDCGLLSKNELEEAIAGARQHLGLKQIDAFWISHMHGDHFLLGPTMKEKYGAEAWTLDRIVDRCENPRRYDYSALVSTYDDGFDGMKIDRPFTDGQSMEWEGYRVQIDWMPGQTEFGCCLWLEMDGKRIAFTGDNIFGYPADPTQDGHEAVVARNSCIFDEGYTLGSRYLMELSPDIIMGSHSYVMDQPQAFLVRYHEWSKEITKIFRDLLPDHDYEYRFDPYWVSAYPYRVDLTELSSKSSVVITVRNFRSEPQSHRVQIKTPPGVVAVPDVIEGTIDARQRKNYPVELRWDPEAFPQKHSEQGNATESQVQMVTLDIQLDEQRYGEWFDFLVMVPAKE